MTGTRILVVASDAHVRATLARWLKSVGYAVELAEGMRHTREVLAHGEIALAVIAPTGLSSAADVDPVSELRGSVRHVIIVGAAGSGTSPSGEPDVSMSAPSAQQDLMRRIDTAVEATSTAGEPGEASRFRFATCTLDAGGRTLRNASGAEIALTRAEFAILLALLRQSGHVLSRDALTQAAVGRGAEPDDRSVDVLVSRLRRKIEPAPKAPRIILTVPGEGYELGVPVEVLPPAAAPPPLAPEATQAAAPVTAQAVTPMAPGAKMTDAAAISPDLPGPLRSFSMAQILAAAAIVGVLAGVAGVAIAFRSSGPAIREAVSRTVPAQSFDAAAVPLVLDVVRTQLASYERERPAKAIAISREGWGVSFGAADETTARNEALERCRERDKGGFCRLYAVGDDVVWPRSSLLLPLAVDIRADKPAISRVTVETLRPLWQSLRRTTPPPNLAEYTGGGENHQALAVGVTNWYGAKGHVSRDEALRIAVERCSDMARTPCLLIAVDGAWTIERPRTYAITAPFTLAGETQMSDAERQRAALVYAGKDWRALVRGRSGRWYPVAEQQSEAAAVDGALKACRAAEAECVLHAIGNWRVGEKLAPAPESSRDK